MEITHNNKTYRWIGDKWGVWRIPENVHISESMQNTIAFFADEYDKEIYPYGEKLMDTKRDVYDLIALGYLEEVKENQKTLDIDKKLTEQFIKNNVACTPCEMGKPNSILEKLRLFLDRKQTDITEIASQYGWSTDLSVKSAILSDIAFFLTSLEQPKEEPEAIKSAENNLKDNDYKIAGVDLKQPQFTPGQMIEVSNDGEKWEKRRYNCNSNIDGFWCVREANDLDNTFLLMR